MKTHGYAHAQSGKGHRRAPEDNQPLVRAAFGGGEKSGKAFYRTSDIPKSAALEIAKVKDPDRQLAPPGRLLLWRGDGSRSLRPEEAESAIAATTSCSRALYSYAKEAFRETLEEVAPDDERFAHAVAMIDPMHAVVHGQPVFVAQVHGQGVRPPSR